jgi:hypothetical protein
MSVDLNRYLDQEGLFVNAFKPLRERLNQQAEACWKEKAENEGFSPWVVHSGKGGKPQYINFHDVSIYRHCMDVAIIAFMTFIYAWQDERIPHPDLPGEMLKPNEDEVAERLLKQLFAIAFLHDADKYWGEKYSTSGDKSKSPESEQIEKLHDALEINAWAKLEVKTYFALASVVEKRGEGQAFFSGIKPPLAQQKLMEMVKIGDKVTSVGSRKGLVAMLKYYNDTKLPSLRDLFAVPGTPLELWVFRHSPVVLHKLQYHFLYDFYGKQIFPLVCLLEGQRFYISVPEGYDFVPVFQALEYEMAFKQSGMKRNPTNGEMTLFDVHSGEDLVKAVEGYDRDNQNNGPKLLAVHATDWENVHNYVKGWAGEIGDLALFDKPEVGKIWSIVSTESTSPPIEYRYALILAVALRADAKGKIFEERLQRLQNLDEEGNTLLQQKVAGLDDMKKDTRQALFAMQATTIIKNEDDLLEAINIIYGDFPASKDDEGVHAIIEQLKMQRDLSNDNPDSHITYSAMPKGGSCLLCGYPTKRAIETSKMKLAGIKSSAFNNRIGHQKNLWSQSDKNYLCPACVKQQDFLCQVQPKLKSEPLIVATPFRGLIKPIDTKGELVQDNNVINSFTSANREKWKEVLPWNIDTSGHFPFVLESIDAGFDSAVDAMYRWAVFALHSGNPVHIFASSQRDSSASFLFEQTPPLIGKLLEDLSVHDRDLDKFWRDLSPQDKKRLGGEKKIKELKAFIPYEHGTVRRNNLPRLVKRLELFHQMLRTNYGHDVLTSMLGFGWWAVAWFQQVSNTKNTRQIELAKQEYPMNKHEESDTLKHIAYLAAQLQRYPGWDAGNSDRTFCLDIALEQFHTTRRYSTFKNDDTTTVAGMAGELEKRFASGRARHAKNGAGGTFSERYGLFAQAVFDFLRTCEKEHRLDNRFHRFLRAAYSHLFMLESLAHSKKNKDESTTQQEPLL